MTPEVEKVAKLLRRKRRVFRSGQLFGQYRIQRRLAEGGFADVYRAMDTVEGILVAIKLPRQDWIDEDLLAGFRKEVRLTASLDHPNILPIKTAGIVEGRFVIVHPLGEGTLADRLRRRLSMRGAYDFGEQLLAALDCAHRKRILHGDIKPDNLILFPNHRLRLADFGIARLAARTLRGSGSGTLGYLAPEQAMGRPSLRSDVFSAGLVLYRMFAGHLPEWPFEWPMPGHDRLRRNAHPELVAVLRKALTVAPQKRFRDATHMLEAFRRVKRKAANGSPTRRRGRKRNAAKADWRTIQIRQFKRDHGKELGARHACERCAGPVSELMTACPWCGKARPKHREAVSFPARCPRCRRGRKLDWRFCPWCYGGAVGPESDREFSDVRYEARCRHAGCSRRDLMPWMRYCPWCRRKVKQRWKIDGSRKHCRSCGHGVLPEYWDFCPWCTKRLSRT